jgi:energy-converting hydrogenase Eha subunit E
MRAVWQAPFVIGAAVLAVAIAYVSTFDLSKPPTDLPLPLGVAIGAALAAIGVLLMLRWSQQMALFAFLAVAQVIAL